MKYARGVCQGECAVMPLSDNFSPALLLLLICLLTLQARTPLYYAREGKAEPCIPLIKRICGDEAIAHTQLLLMCFQVGDSHVAHNVVVIFGCVLLAYLAKM